MIFYAYFSLLSGGAGLSSPILYTEHPTEKYQLSLNPTTEKTYYTMLITAAMMLAVSTANRTAELEITLPAPCLGSYSCGPDSSNIGYFYPIPSAVVCRRECDAFYRGSVKCKHFTFFSSGYLSGACFIFASCQQRSTLCQGECVSGPRCVDCETCARRRVQKRILSILRST